MKKIVLRYGLYSGLLMLLFGVISMYFAQHATPENFGSQMLFGYVSIVVALVFIYFGIRYYRDKVNGGLVTFGEGVKLGLLISLLPSIVFGSLDSIYRIFNPDYIEHCEQLQVEVLKHNTPAAQLPAELAKMHQQMEFFNNYPVAGWAFMFLTVFVVGVIVSVISALMLQRKVVQTT